MYKYLQRWNGFNFKVQPSEELVEDLITQFLYREPTWFTRSIVWHTYLVLDTFITHSTHSATAPTPSVLHTGVLVPCTKWRSIYEYVDNISTVLLEYWSTVQCCRWQLIAWSDACKIINKRALLQLHTIITTTATFTKDTDVNENSIVDYRVLTWSIQGLPLSQIASVQKRDFCVLLQNCVRVSPVCTRNSCTVDSLQKRSARSNYIYIYMYTYRISQKYDTHAVLTPHPMTCRQIVIGSAL